MLDDGDDEDDRDDDGPGDGREKGRERAHRQAVQAIAQLWGELQQPLGGPGASTAALVEAAAMVCAGFATGEFRHPADERDVHLMALHFVELLKAHAKTGVAHMARVERGAAS